MFILHLVETFQLTCSIILATNMARLIQLACASIILAEAVNHVKMSADWRLAFLGENQMTRWILSHRQVHKQGGGWGGGGVGGFKHPPLEIRKTYLFLSFLMLASLSERSVMYEDTPIHVSGKLTQFLCFRKKKKKCRIRDFSIVWTGRWLGCAYVTLRHKTCTVHVSDMDVRSLTRGRPPNRFHVRFHVVLSGKEIG